MSVIIKEVVTPSDITKFVKLPFSIYKNNSFWVPPINADEKKSLMPEHNPAFQFCKSKFWLAYKEGKLMGRIGAIINEKHNEKMGEKNGRFSRAEFFNDIEVSTKLFETAENWLKEQGMTKILGPLGFTNLDTQGLLIEGFEHLPSIASVYHLPYYKEHIEKLGYLKEIDWVEFRLTMNDVPEKALKLNEMIKMRYKMRVQTFTSTKELLTYRHQIFGVLNEAFAELFSVTAFDQKMIEYYAIKYLKVLNPKFVKLIFLEDNELAGFIVGLPSLSEAFQKANGKLFPFGFYHILQALKKPKVMDLILTGILPKYQAKGVSAILITEIHKTIHAEGVAFVETTGIFETNHDAINHWKSYEHIQHKRRRCFVKKF